MAAVVRPIVPLLFPVFALSAGCVRQALTGHLAGLVLKDLRAAAQIAEPSAPLLPAGDPWGPCARALADTLVKLQAGPGLDIAGAGVMTEALRLHVLDVVAQQAPPEVTTQCGAASWTLAMRAGRRLPGR